MVFSSVVFLFYFLPIFFLLYFILPNRYKNVLALLFSLFFYAWGEPYYVLLMVFSIVVNYFLGCSLSFEKTQAQRKLFVIVACVFNLALLIAFKYLTFLGQSIYALFGAEKTFPAIALPLGISFYTFQALSYVLDVYRKSVPVQKNLVNLALYVSMFPQLVAGPIVRYGDVNNEINCRIHSTEETANGIFRFAIGLGKKVLLANMLGMLADSVWKISGLQFSVVTAWTALIAYTLQIYFDFGGYSDMAIGLGQMMGFHFNENFNYPYISLSISEFWRRWHISLGSWFRDYVYIPLGGSRTSRPKLLRNLMVVWLLTGLWHGANWTFLVWGLYYGCLICIEKFFRFEQRGIPCYIRRISSLLLIMVGWVIFRSNSIPEAFSFFGRLLGVGGTGLIDSSAYLFLHDNIVLILLGCIGCTPLIKAACIRVFGTKQTWLVQMLKCGIILLLLGLSTLYLVNATYNPFIYFRF